MIVHSVLTKIQQSKMKDFAEKKGYGNWETMKARSRPILSQVSDAEIALKYSVEMRGFAQYYAIAVNFSAMNKLRYLWVQSFLKTMANKYKSSMQKMATMLNRGGYMAVREKDRLGDRLREPNWRFTLCTARSMPSNNAKRLLLCCFAVTEHL
jgi:hypothetical protein